MILRPSVSEARHEFSEMAMIFPQAKGAVTCWAMINKSSFDFPPNVISFFDAYTKSRFISVHNPTQRAPSKECLPPCFGKKETKIVTMDIHELSRSRRFTLQPWMFCCSTKERKISEIFPEAFRRRDDSVGWATLTMTQGILWKSFLCEMFEAYASRNYLAGNESFNGKLIHVVEDDGEH